MGKFLTHEAIAGQYFATDVSVAAPQSAWLGILTTNERSLLLLAERMSQDYSRLNAKMRKPWGSKDLETRPHRQTQSYMEDFLSMTFAAITNSHLFNTCFISGRAESMLPCVPGMREGLSREVPERLL